jgi:nucleotide-binding universal stress UspA family protein
MESAAVPTPEAPITTAAGGVVWIVVMTWIVVIGIELSARTQIGLLAAEIFTLALFAIVALIKIDVADEREARMIVVGSFGEAPLKSIVLGSTTNKLLHLTERPVLVVPAEEK